MKTLDDFADVLVTGRDVAARGHPALVALEPVGGRWLRLDTSSDSALIRTEPGVCLDHDRGLMRITKERKWAKGLAKWIGEGRGDPRFYWVDAIGSGRAAASWTGASAYRPKVGEKWSTFSFCKGKGRD